MQSLSRDWICDARMAWGWFDTATAMEEETYAWEVTMQDICRRWTDESEGHMSMAVMQRVLQRTFTAFVKAKGDHWLLGLLDMLFFDLNLSIYLIMWLLASWWSVLNQGFSICHQCWTLLLPKDVCEIQMPHHRWDEHCILCFACAWICKLHLLHGFADGVLFEGCA